MCGSDWCKCQAITVNDWKVNIYSNKLFMFVIYEFMYNRNSMVYYNCTARWWLYELKHVVLCYTTRKINKTNLCTGKCDWVLTVAMLQWEPKIWNSSMIRARMHSTKNTDSSLLITPHIALSLQCSFLKPSDYEKIRILNLFRKHQYSGKCTANYAAWYPLPQNDGRNHIRFLFV
jgi:hypothetical protein